MRAIMARRHQASPSRPRILSIYQMLTKELQLSSIRIAPGCFRRRYESAGTRKLNGIQHEKHMTSGLNGDEIAIGGRTSSG
jgi:hypothetical protein